MLSAVLVLALVPSAPKNNCDAAAIFASIESLYSIKGKDANDKIPFLDKPSAKAKKSKTELGIGAMLLAGGPKNDDFRCVVFGDPSGALITGWIPVNNLQKIDRDESELNDQFLAGKWLGEAGSVDLDKRSDKIVHAQVKSKAGHPVLEDEAQQDLKKLTFMEDEDDESSCRITIERRGPFLLVNDNAHCGATKVRTMGIFAKKK